MKILLLLTIKVYWAIVPKAKRRKCLFRTSCSKYVYQTTEKEGFCKGIQAFKYRFQNCRSGFQLLNNPINGNIIMVLSNYQILTEEEISERFIN